MNPRVHHLDGAEAVYDGGDCFRLCLENALVSFLEEGQAVDWRGFFAAARARGWTLEQALGRVVADHRLAFGADLRAGDPRMYAGLCGLAGEVYG